MSTGLLRSPLLCTDVPGTSTSRWPWISIPVRFRFVGGWGGVALHMGAPSSVRADSEVRSGVSGHRLSTGGCLSSGLVSWSAFVSCDAQPDTHSPTRTATTPDHTTPTSTSHVEMDVATSLRLRRRRCRAPLISSRISPHTTAVSCAHSVLMGGVPWRAGFGFG